MVLEKIYIKQALARKSTQPSHGKDFASSFIYISLLTITSSISSTFLSFIYRSLFQPYHHSCPSLSTIRLCNLFTPSLFLISLPHLSTPSLFLISLPHLSSSSLSPSRSLIQGAAPPQDWPISHIRKIGNQFGNIKNLR